LVAETLISATLPIGPMPLQVLLVLPFAGPGATTLLTPDLSDGPFPLAKSQRQTFRAGESTL